MALATRETARPHLIAISVALAVAFTLHYATYLQIAPGFLDSLINSRFRVIFDAELLAIVIYAGSVFRIKGSAMALGVAAVTLVPMIFTTMNLEEEHPPDELRNHAIEVALIVLIGTLAVTVQEMIACEREGRERLSYQMENTSRQLSALNRISQKGLADLLDEIDQVRVAAEREMELVTGQSPMLARQRYPLFLQALTDTLVGIRLSFPGIDNFGISETRQELASKDSSAREKVKKLVVTPDSRPFAMLIARTESVEVTGAGASPLRTPHSSSAC